MFDENLHKCIRKCYYFPIESVKNHVIKEGGDMKIIQIPVEMIIPNPEQPRKIFTDDELGELTCSIREYGVLQPLIVKKAEGRRFILIAGERRLRASKLAGLSRVPVIIKELPEHEAALISLVENVQRENLNFLEEARAYKKLMDDFNLTQAEIAKKVSKKQSTISNKIRLLSLPEELQQMLLENKLTERHARALLKVDNVSDRKKILHKVIDNNLNVKQTEKLVDDFISGKEKAARKKNKINYISYKIYLNTIRKAFNQVKTVEKEARFIESDQGDFMEVKIIIPKKDRCFT